MDWDHIFRWFGYPYFFDIVAINLVVFFLCKSNKGFSSYRNLSPGLNFILVERSCTMQIDIIMKFKSDPAFQWGVHNYIWGLVNGSKAWIHKLHNHFFTFGLMAILLFFPIHNVRRNKYPVSQITFRLVQRANYWAYLWPFTSTCFCRRYVLEKIIK